MIKSIELQDIIFESNPSRMDLLDYIPKQNDTYRILVYRNHSFELIENTIKIYLDYANISIKFEYSDYDDSLSFSNLNIDSDLIILWIDLSRYSIKQKSDFFSERFTYLKKLYSKNILFIPFGERISIQDSIITQYNLEKIKLELGSKYLDVRLESISGTKISSTACLKVSKDLGLNYIPALLKPSLKAIVVDLDNTLYSGVLGEDGIEGVNLTDAHKNLQKKLKSLKDQGFFLCIASKNDERDVINLFSERNDFPLKLEDFTKIYANWGHKSDNIEKIRKFLNVGMNSLLFIDDNIGEILSVLRSHPDINIILAKDDAQTTLNVLNNYPGLLKLNINTEDKLRNNDIKLNEKRREMQESLSEQDYLKSLEIEVCFSIKNHSHIDRISELSKKTNQFIFSYKRYSVKEVSDMMFSSDYSIVTVCLKDKLSDSGNIGSVIVKKEKDVGILEECFVSCRALGRGFDELIVMGSIEKSLGDLKLKKLRVNFTKGSRNLPAENFCDKFFKKFISKASYYEFNNKLKNIINITTKE